MALNDRELRELHSIEQALTCAHPGLARRFGEPITRHRTWMTVSYMTLAVCAVLSLVGLLLGEVAASIPAGVALMTVYPLCLTMAKKRHSGKR